MDRPMRSRHGLTRCRACRAHIHAAAKPSETTCPFCGENQLGIPRSQARGTIVAVGRGGILAAGLMAFSALGCGADDPTPGPVEAPIVEAPIVEAPEPMQPMQPGEVVVAPIPEPEPVAPEPVAPEPVVEEPAPEPIVERPRPRPRPQPDPVAPPDRPIAVPAYGVAPPDQWRPDPAPDMRPTPRYGLPPMRQQISPEPSEG